MGTIKGRGSEAEKLRKMWDLSRGLALVNLILSDEYRKELRPLTIRHQDCCNSTPAIAPMASPLIKNT